MIKGGLRDIVIGAGIGKIMMPRKDFMKEHKKLLGVLKSGDPKKLAAEYKDQKAELEQQLKGGILNEGSLRDFHFYVRDFINSGSTFALSRAVDELSRNRRQIDRADWNDVNQHLGAIDELMSPFMGQMEIENGNIKQMVVGHLREILNLINLPGAAALSGFGMRGSGALHDSLVPFFNVTSGDVPWLLFAAVKLLKANPNYAWRLNKITKGIVIYYEGGLTLEELRQIVRDTAKMALITGEGKGKHSGLAKSLGKRIHTARAEEGLNEESIKMLNKGYLNESVALMEIADALGKKKEAAAKDVKEKVKSGYGEHSGLAKSLGKRDVLAKKEAKHHAKGAEETNRGHIRRAAKHMEVAEKSGRKKEKFAADVAHKVREGYGMTGGAVSREAFAEYTRAVETFKHSGLRAPLQDALRSAKAMRSQLRPVSVAKFDEIIEDMEDDVDRIYRRSVFPQNPDERMSPIDKHVLMVKFGKLSKLLFTAGRV